MPWSLSVRIAEGFLSKEIPILPLETICEIAQQHHFSALCMRASQLGIHAASDNLSDARAVLKQHDLSVSMITGDFDIVYNNERGPHCLRNIAPYVALAEGLGASMIRVALKSEDDIAAARSAADYAAERGIDLVHQCHTLSLFETVDSIESTLRAIGRPNFGLIFEPANLELCGQDYGAETLSRLAPWIKNVYLQNQRISTQGSITLDTWCRGPVPFDILPLDDPRGIDFAIVFAGLDAIGYRGYLTIHQSAPEGTSAMSSIGSAVSHLRSLTKMGDP